MNRSLKQFKKQQKGSGTVEFAIVLIGCLMMLFGIIDFGRALYTYHLVSNGARQGSRYAIVRGSECAVSGCPATNSSIQTYIQGLSPDVNTASLTVTTTWSSTSTCNTSPFQGPGCLVTVKVQYPFTFIGPFLPTFTMPMSSTSEMIISQ